MIGDRQVKAGTPDRLETGPDPGRENRRLPAGRNAGQRGMGCVSALRPAGASWIGWSPTRSASSLSNASNMLDVTWEAPDGNIIPLDGYLDPYFQEVYLEAASVPIFSKLAQHVSANALDDYVEQLEHEVHKYLTKDVNYGKVAKRMYNIFRLTGRYEEAAFLRELFDEPATILYQVWSLIRTIDDAYSSGLEHLPRGAGGRCRPPDHGCDQSAGG